MYTTIRNELHHVRKAWPGTLVDPCLLFGHGYNSREETEAILKEFGGTDP